MEVNIRMHNYRRKVYALDLPSRAKSVYFYLLDRCDKDMKCFPGIKTISRHLSISESTVRRAIKDLENAKLIRKEIRIRGNGTFSSNTYYLI